MHTYRAKIIHKNDRGLYLDSCPPNTYVPSLGVTIHHKVKDDPEAEGIFMVTLHNLTQDFVQREGEGVGLKISEEDLDSIEGREDFVFKESAYRTVVAYEKDVYDTGLAPDKRLKLTLKQTLARILPAKRDEGIRKCIYVFARRKWRKLYNKYIEEHGGAVAGCRALPLEVAVRYGFLLFEYARNTLVDKMKEHGVVLRECDEWAEMQGYEEVDVSDAESEQ